MHTLTKQLSTLAPLKRTLLVCLSMGLSVAVLSGCKSNSDPLSKLDSAVSGEYCQSNAKPFVHALCQVSQEDISADNSPLSLRLFWKSGQVANSNVHDKEDNEDHNQRYFADTDQSREPLYTFDALLNDLPSHTELVFAANAGMYNSSFAPIGYTVIQGQQILSLNLNDGAGNFHLTPNGVLWWDDNHQVHITESHTLGEMLDNGTAKPLYASQSGPMLVINNDIHPKFNPSSTSLKIRNGVGVCDDGNIKFVTSNEPINFYQFAAYFKDTLHCPNALFLDGGIASAIYAPSIHQKEDKNMGVMVGLVKNTQ